MYLIELLLPLCDAEGRKIPRDTFARVRDELTEMYGGVTAFTRSPAQGTWMDSGGEVERDEIVVCEVMAETLDRKWWTAYRGKLEDWFGQKELVVRATETRRL